MMSGRISGLDKKTIGLWKAFHTILQPVEVIIPFAPEIGRFITESPGVPISARRAFNRVMAVTQTVACTYQHQRKKDPKGRVVAEIADYYMALQVVREAFRESVGQESKETEKRVAFIEQKGWASYRVLSEEWGVSKSAISQWAYTRVKEGMLVWCDDSGNEFADANDLKKAKSSGKAFLRLSDTYMPSKSIGLPTPFDLTKDAAWEEGGPLSEKYDLELEARKGIKAPLAIKGALSSGLNTDDGGEPVDISENSDDEPEGFKALSEFMDSIEPEFPSDENHEGNGKGRSVIDPTEGILTV